MIDLFHAARARRAAMRRIPVYYSAVPTVWPHLWIATVALLAVMVLAFTDAPAQAQTAMTSSTPAITLAQSAPAGPPPGGADGQRPPREAMEACASAPLESDCSFAGREGETITGTCLSPETDVPAACVPADMPQNG